MSLAPYRLVYLPVGFAEAADRIVALIERGVLHVQDHWASREACQSFIDRQPRGLHQSYAPTLAIVRDAGDAGRAVPPPCVAASMTDRRDGGRVSGYPIQRSEEGGGANDRPRSGQRDVALSSATIRRRVA